MGCEKLRIGSRRVRAYVQSFKNETKVHIRNFDTVESGECFPTKKGVTLNLEEWESLKSHIQTLDSEFKRKLKRGSEASKEKST